MGKVNDEIIDSMTSRRNKGNGNLSHQPGQTYTFNHREIIYRLKERIIKPLNIISYVVLNELTQILNKNSETHLPLCEKNSSSGPTQSVNYTMKCT